MNVNNIRFKNHQSCYAGKTLNWFNTDSRENFIKNVNNNFDILQQNDWMNKVIEYKFNSHGFRTDDFSSGENIIFLGCSITVGVGLQHDDLYATKIAKIINLKCCNLAIAGAGYDTAFRMLFSYAPIIKPKIVVLHMNFPGRIEMLYENQCTLLLPRTENHPEFYKNWLMTEENIFINEQKNIMAIKNICNNIGAKFINTAEFTNWVSLSKPTLARDLIHPGVTAHSKIADSILLNI